MFIGIAPYALSPYSRFARTSQGKVAELRQELSSGGKKDKNYSAKKIALKKIVANMTMSNNDMVALFPDVIECMNLPSLEIKKMYARDQGIPCAVPQVIQDTTSNVRFRCFLFLVNYSRMKPDVAMKALPILVDVCVESQFSKERETPDFTANRLLGYGRFESARARACVAHNIIRSCARIRRSNLPAS